METCSPTLRSAMPRTWFPLRWATQAVATFCLLLGILACGGGGGGVTAPPPPTVQLTQQHGTFFISWAETTRPSKILVSTTLNGAVVGASFDVPARNDILIYFTGTLPENTLVIFQFQYSGGSPNTSVSVNAGPYPASGLTVTTQDIAAHLSWTRTSAVADHVRVDRVLLDSNGNPSGPVVPLATLDGGVTSYDDATGTEGLMCQYVVTYLSQNTVGPGITWSFSFPTPFPVGALTVTATNQGPKIKWTNRSTAATSNTVFRAPGLTTATSYQQIATLSPTVQEYVDTDAAAGAFTYWVVTQSSLSSSESSRTSFISDPPGTGTPLRSSVLTLPATNHLSLQSAGWYLKDANLSRLLSPSPTGWLPVDLPTGSCAYPFVLEDASGQPHLVVSTPALTHIWRVGDSWRQEVIAQRSIRDNQWANNFQFTLDKNGAVHVLWENDSANLSGGLEYATNAGGSWHTVTIPNSTAIIFGASLDVDATSQAYVLFAQSTPGLTLVTIPSGGTPSVETVPTGPLTGLLYNTCLVGALSDRISIFFDGFVEPSTYALRVVSKTAGGWGQTENILGRTPSGRTNFPMLRRNPAGSRSAVMLDSGLGILVATATTGGPWTQRLLGLETYGPYAFGFTSTDKLFVGLGAGMMAPGTAQAQSLVVLYQE